MRFREEIVTWTITVLSIALIIWIAIHRPAAQHGFRLGF